MVCCQIFGNNTTMTVAGSQGISSSMSKAGAALCDAAIAPADGGRGAFLHGSLRGRNRADEARMRELMERSLMLVTALAPAIGYDRAAQIANPRTPTGRPYGRRRCGSAG